MEYSYDTQHAQHLKRVFQLLCRKHALPVLDFVIKNQGKNVTKIYRALEKEQSVVSGMLGCFRSFNMVTGIRTGQCVIYTVTDENKKHIDFYLNLMLQLQAFQQETKQTACNTC